MSPMTDDQTGGQTARQRAREIFDQFDVNGDGSLTATELSKVLAELGGGAPLDESVAQSLIDGPDADGDGRLSFEEFWTARQAAGLA